MSTPSWRSLARDALQRLRPLRETDRAPTTAGPRVAVVGIGQTLRGDDGVGPEIIRALAARRAAASDRAGSPDAPTLLLLDAGHAPENQTGPLRRFAPDLILLIDAARMEAPPGTIRWLTWDETAGVAGSTHTLSPSLLAEFLTRDLGCQVALIGIQPLTTAMGDSLSPPVRAAVSEIGDALAGLLGI